MELWNARIVSYSPNERAGKAEVLGREELVLAVLPFRAEDCILVSGLLIIDQEEEGIHPDSLAELAMPDRTIVFFTRTDAAPQAIGFWDFADPVCEE